jgi:hypothetical protein
MMPLVSAPGPIVAKAEEAELDPKQTQALVFRILARVAANLINGILVAIMRKLF